MADRGTGEGSMDEPLRAHTINEARYWLRVAPCPQCGSGPLRSRVAADAAAGEPITVDAECAQCGLRRGYRFVCEHGVGQSAPDAETINPTDEPSRLIDVAQWLSLFYVLIEAGARERSASATRLAGYRAALCLAEALKFYGEGELPPEEAFFSARTLQSFRDHPESFTRQRLQDRRSKLPAMGTMARRVSQDRPKRRRRWWPFGRRR